MGRNKALLEWDGMPLVARAAQTVREAAGHAAIIGDPDTYASLGFRVIPDNFPGFGPLAGIEAALAATDADWNLVIACDMPALTPGFLSRLIEAAEQLPDAFDCLAPQAQPLCAVWNRRVHARIADLLRTGIRRVQDALTQLTVQYFPVPDASHFQNVNTLSDWATLTRRSEPSL